MYKLVIGNVKISVLEDNIKRDQAIAAAKHAIYLANQNGKLLSHVEVGLDDSGIKVKTIEKIGAKVARKTIKHSMLDTLRATVREKLYPTSAFASQDSWYDSDTGQEWRGLEVETARNEILAKFEEWCKTL